MCETCGGVTIKLNLLKKIFDEDGLQGILTQAREHRQTGCLCPDCGLPMTLLHVASGKKSIEIDVCAKCQAIWYDKNEFETLVPSDGILQPNVSAGKAYRREMAMTLEADLRNGKLKVNNLSQLKTQMQTVYHVPVPDISPLIGTLQCRKVISLAPQTGKINIPLQQ